LVISAIFICHPIIYYVCEEILFFIRNIYDIKKVLNFYNQGGGDKLGGDKLGGDKLGGDKLGGDKLGGDKLGVKTKNIDNEYVFITKR
jgi:hypothetical protein